MTYFPDLAPCRYYGDEWSHRRLSVGWLELGHEYSGGPVAPAVLERLRDMMNYATGMSLGSHFCEFCLGHTYQNAGWGRVASGSVTLSVPGDRGCVYETPQLVVHYIEAHNYQPPAEFCEAVLACPPPWSDDYFLAIQRAFPEAPYDIERMRQFTACAICAAIINSPAVSNEDRARYSDYARLVMSAPRPTNLPEPLLLGQADDGNETAIDPLTHAHLALMIRICKEYEHRGLRLIDLIDEGCVALSHAAVAFDAGRDRDFAAYASRKVRDALELRIAEYSQSERGRATM